MRYMKRRNFVEIICHSQSGQKYLIKDKDCDNTRGRVIDFEKIVLDEMLAKQNIDMHDWGIWDIEKKRNSLRAHFEKVVTTYDDTEIHWH